MQRTLLVVTLVALAAVCWLALKRVEPSHPPTAGRLNVSKLPPAPAVSTGSGAGTSARAPVPAKSAEVLPEPAPSSDAVAQATPVGAATAITDPSGLAPEIVLENMRATVRQYAAAFGGNPVGNNLEITQALEGHNPKGIHFLKLEGGLRQNEAGELIDSWGTRYFFHQLSAQEMEVRSAGPDRIMWTADDLTSHGSPGNLPARFRRRVLLGQSVRRKRSVAAPIATAQNRRRKARSGAMAMRPVFFSARDLNPRTA